MKYHKNVNVGSHTVKIIKIQLTEQRLTSSPAYTPTVEPMRALLEFIVNPKPLMLVEYTSEVTT